jgi:type II secretory pathway component PulJ
LSKCSKKWWKKDIWWMIYNILFSYFEWKSGKETSKK